MNKNSPSNNPFHIYEELEKIRIKRLDILKKELLLRENQSSNLTKQIEHLSPSTKPELINCLNELHEQSNKIKNDVFYWDLIELSMSFTGTRKQMKGGYPIANVLSRFNISYLSSPQIEIISSCIHVLLMDIEYKPDLLQKFNGFKKSYSDIYRYLPSSHSDILLNSIIATAYTNYPFNEHNLVDGIYIAIYFQEQGLEPSSKYFPKIDKDKLLDCYFFRQ